MIERLCALGLGFPTLVPEKNPLLEDSDCDKTAVRNSKQLNSQKCFLTCFRITLSLGVRGLLFLLAQMKIRTRLIPTPRGDEEIYLLDNVKSRG